MQRSATLLFTCGFALAASITAMAADSGSPSAGSTPPSTGTPGTPGSGATTATDSKSIASPGTSSAPGSSSTSSNAADSPAKGLFDQLDANKDGVLTLEEFSRAQFQQR